MYWKIKDIDERSWIGGFIKEEYLKNVKTPVRIYEVLTEYSKTVYHTGANDE